MSTLADPAPAYGRRLVEQARRLDTHPNSITRHIRNGVLLRDGSRLRLRATVTPGGYRITDADVDAFYEALTADRLGESAPASCADSPNKSHRAAAAALEASGW